jgi:hypothetical protein
MKARSDWFYRGRIVHGKDSAELRRRAYEEKMRMRAQRRVANAAVRANAKAGPTSLPWTPLGPVPLASDATGNGTQNYNQVAGRATAVAIDPADSSGNTVYIGGAQGGIWKSTNAANTTANNVAWAAIADDQATLSVGAIAIQPGNTNPAESVILAATGEANNSADAYFGVGILVSTNAGGSHGVQYNDWASEHRRCCDGDYIGGHARRRSYREHDERALYLGQRRAGLDL